MLLCTLGSACVSKADLVTDTPPEEANSIALHNVIPIEEAAPDTAVQVIKVDGKKVEQLIITQPTVADLRSAVKKVYTRNIGVRELTGKNDGKSVEIYLASVGMKKGAAWCAAFVHFCLERGGVRNPITAWSPTAFNKNSIVWHQRRLKREPKTADVVTFYYPNKKRIAHCGFYDARVNDAIYESVEGNTGASGAIGEIVNEGDGVYKKKRSFNATYAISSFIKD